MTHHFGFVSLVGRPNTGKSTLLNHILGDALCITSNKPQTTRSNFLGLKKFDDAQLAFVDTPGMHRGYKSALNRSMDRAAVAALHDMDVVVLLVDCSEWSDDDEWVARRVNSLAGDKFSIVAINKIDRLARRELLLPRMDWLSQRFPQAEIVPISALKGDNVDHFQDCVKAKIPEGEAMFPGERLTDRSDEYLAAEALREKLMRRLNQEVPYGLGVTIERFESDEKKKLLSIDALIWADQARYKGIVIGARGERLREIGRAARISMERLFHCRVMLRVWVKVKKDWRNDPRYVAALGYE